MFHPDLPDLGVILAAGGGLRMGQPKGLLLLDGEPLVMHHVRALRPFCARVLVVIGAAAEAHRQVLSGEADWVENGHWADTWPVDSLALALKSAPLVDRCLVTPVDTPPAGPSTLAAIVGASPPVVPQAPDGADGHPVLIGPAEVQAIRHGSVAGGLRTLLKEAVRVPVSEDVGLDFNDPEAWSTFAARG